MKKIITLDVLKNNYGNQKKIEFPQGTIVTPEARIWAKNQGIELLVDNEYLDLSVNSNYSNDKTSKVVVSVIGLDKVGIIAVVNCNTSVFQIKNFIYHLIQEITVMRYNQDSLVVILQKSFQPLNRF